MDQERVWATDLLDRLTRIPHRLGLVVSSAALLVIYVASVEVTKAAFLVPFSIPKTNSAVFWLPSGLVFALFVRARSIPSLWPGWLLALWVGQFIVVRNQGLPLVTAVLWAASTVLLALTTGLLARRYLVGPCTLRRVRDALVVIAMTTVAVVPGALVAAAGAVVGVGAPSFVGFALAWANSDALGIILLAPVLLAWTVRQPRAAGGALEAAALIGVITAVSALLFFRLAPTLPGHSVLVLLSLCIAWASMRFGPRATTVVVLLVDSALIAATAQGLGPLDRWDLSPEARLLNLQLLVATVAILTLLLGAAIEEQRMARAAAEASHTEAQVLLGQLRRVNDELGALTVQLHTSKEEERRHIVQELHDGVGQLLTAAKINLRLAGRQPTPEASQRKIDEAVQLIDQGIDGVRQLSRGMRPPLLDEAGLVVALETFLDGQRRLTGLELTLRAAPELRRLPPSTEVALFRIVQEALTNVVRHASAKSVVVHVEATADGIETTVRDDGQGFDVDAVVGKTLAAHHLGLVGMRERARAIGASFSITSGSGRGTQVSVRLPLPG